MAKAEICPGICGFKATVDTRLEGSQCAVKIESECKAIQRLAADLTQVDPLREFIFKGEGPLTLQLAAKYCNHAACPVPTGIIKAIEVEAGLALPADVTIKLSKSEE